jgi:poly-gamma-glutamate synthesis protein (capsule biosynthesis protein)
VRAAVGLVCAGALVLGAGCTDATPREMSSGAPDADPPAAHVTEPAGSPQVTLAFGGDVHFEAHLADLLDGRGSALRDITRPLSSADVAMVNLESAIAGPGAAPGRKELEHPGQRYWFRTTPAALDVLSDAGVDVVSLANNHGADFGTVGIRRALAAATDSSVALVGVGADREEAFTPYRVSVGGTDIAVLAGDASFRESRHPSWEAGPGNPGLAAARNPRALVAAVERAAATSDVVVVYLHWGEEYATCPTADQRRLARSLATAGADVVVGSHPHVLQGSGWLGDTYVSYSLGNLLWYHNGRPDTGVLRLRVVDGRVVGDTWVPARTRASSEIRVLQGPAAKAAVADWEALRRCTGLAPAPPRSDPPESQGFRAGVARLSPAARKEIASSHGRGCPVGLDELRLLRLTYVGFDGDDHRGQLVVHRRWARDVVGVFERLYDAGFPLQAVRPVSDFGGDDDVSMVANNTSGYNCRRVAGSSSWSAHAYGRAIDINPLQNPYLHEGTIDPPAGIAYAYVDRSRDAQVARGVIRADDVVVRAFADIGWEWGGSWLEPDYQHFSAPR